MNVNLMITYDCTTVYCPPTGSWNYFRQTIYDFRLVRGLTP